MEDEAACAPALSRDLWETGITARSIQRGIKTLINLGQFKNTIHVFFILILWQQNCSNAQEKFSITCFIKWLSRLDASSHECKFRSNQFNSKKHVLDIILIVCWSSRNYLLSLWIISGSVILNKEFYLRDILLIFLLKYYIFRCSFVQYYFLTKC